jgi:glycosyltransferase involved in cell wall biosynthesis
VEDNARRTILHLDSGREMRGGQWQLIRLMRGLRKRGHDNLLLARANGPLLERGIRENFKCDTIGIASIRWASKLAEIVHAHDARSHTLAAIWTRRPLLVSRRVTFPVSTGLLSRWKYRRADLYAAVSQIVAEELRAAGVPDKKIRVVYDGVPALPNRWSFKGPVVVPRFHDARKANTLPLEAARLANAPVIRSTDLEADLNGAGMLVYLTYSEGLGSAALLAMSAGVPVVVSDVGGLREVVQQGETGLLVPNELDAVAVAIRSLRESPEFAERLSRNARQMALEKFGEDRMVSETLALYDSILEDAGRR